MQECFNKTTSVKRAINIRYSKIRLKIFDTKKPRLQNTFDFRLCDFAQNRSTPLVILVLEVLQKGLGHKKGLTSHMEKTCFEPFYFHDLVSKQGPRC